MENKIYDEKNGLWYEKQGDYYLPCLELPNEETEPIGIWGQRHLHYLKSNRKITYYNLLTSRKLSTYLANIDKQAEDMFSRLVKQMAEREGVTEQHKVDNPMEWVGRMNNIRSRAAEIVNHDIIYN
ncbi:TnpV protein [Roseburia sp. AF02-12]|uniref:TnpV protein n=1 Tax=unclassified Roseburia TaxID=2637578 RepID=UPI000E4D53E9|nr:MULTISPECIES: TnpV protein [unclassified Roseburia]RGF54607.1 TnpV protein [Roseburia sp. AF34-16]RGH29990.1 TnpV protein [Roseburia sp. AF02-12]